MRAFSKFQVQFLAPGMALSLLLILSPPAKSQGQIAEVKNAEGRTVFVNASVDGHAVWLPSQPARSNTAGAVRRSPPASIRRTVRQEAGRANVDPKLVRAIIKVESDGNAKAVSPKGARGLMQLIPATARRFGVSNRFDPGQNIHGGVTYLRYLLDLFKGNVPLTLAAYNAGEHRVLRQGGIPPIPETENYVRRVTSFYHAQAASSQDENTLGPARPPAIYRFVDSSGVIHFATGDDDLPQNVQLAENGTP